VVDDGGALSAARRFGLPLPFLTLALLFVRPRRWLLSQVAASLLLVFP